MRILLFLLLIFLLYQLWRFSELRAKMIRKKTVKTQPKIEAHPMVQCQRCETFVPKNESIDYKGRAFCGEKCRDESRP
ncbi:MAG: hypothetical protein A3I75_01435 [Deltaproteobacteria bacterium RIFCSPLOWO2_02_FULL_50_16]|nr:MAG: hypothetical protein A2053_01090 [Deltaproteobacteria bacterium GWA2_50_8]OGQ30623.1 MAG: hypothetical protein A3B79_05360 [Deltaproteobacteria bacterium RIFCSPHIGHO2_02_FULL_50_15]OGQ58046.1 MAG: hypothetical protein A3I75_01435 [Deltaproteobacteria bacterium RIFCSPLOWO2_02_FULL_50_16]OGQ67125.1 MAG: hypothetical protein A3F89_07830 [Deltaproteobacteria bacterium RIFCSPLOWO2_12_FULL_50_11]